MVDSSATPPVNGTVSGSVADGNLSPTNKASTQALEASWFLPGNTQSLHSITAIPNDGSTSKDPEILAARVLAHICE